MKKNPDRQKNIFVPLALLIALILAAGFVFANLAEDIINRETLFVLDPFIGSWIISQTTLSGSRIFLLITAMGNAFVISSGTFLLGYRLAKWKQRGHLAFFLSAVAGSALLNFILKNVFLRPRPDYRLPGLVVTGFSFPSGHAMISLAFYGAMAYIAFQALKGRRMRVAAVVGLALAPLLIGFSRLYLGVHYLTDVLAGWSAGFAWLAACILTFEIVKILRAKDRILS